jgi:hypothetical protein
MVIFNIFKLFFMSVDKQKYMNEFISVIEKNFKTETESKGELLYQLIKSKFLDINDFKK